MQQFTPQPPRRRRGCSPFGLLAIPVWGLPSVYLVDIAFHLREYGANGAPLAVGAVGAVAALALPVLMSNLPGRLLAQALGSGHRQTEDGTIIVSDDTMSAMLRRIYFIVGLVLAVAVLNMVTYTFLDVRPRVYIWIFVQIGLVPPEFAD